ncbi:MAG: metallophosphoesterase [Phycisphaerales bacterium]|nr:metallophosphoesterase [Phycisphaerales bacterium]
MKIGVISDTHDRLPAIDTALAEFRRRDVRILIHPGDIIAPFAARRLATFDGELHVTYGNNDGERSGLKAVLPQIQDGPLHVTIAGRRILVHHFVDWCKPADVALAEIVITGHTHEKFVQRREGRLFINPGECCGWVTGECSIGVLDLASDAYESITLPGTN